MTGHSSVDFGYPWWLAYGHLALAAFFAAWLLIGVLRKWRRRWLVMPGVLLLWALSSFLMVHTALDVNGRATLPTENFLRSGSGRVLDIGAGTGRSSLMVLEARPQVRLVALDLFGDSYDMHFGKGLSPEQRLMANLRAAGVDQRASIAKGDMRELPYPAASFDGVVSSFAMDHLNREGSTKSIQEAARVLKPGGEFLLTVFAKDLWIQYTFGPFLLHSSIRGNQWWADRMREAGLELVEQGNPPGMLYILARRTRGD